MKKLTKTVLLSFLITVFVLFSGGCPTPDTNELYRAADLPQRDEKIFSNVTIEDDFDDSSLIVILDNFTGGVNKKHEERLFGDFEKEYIGNL